MKTPSLLLLIIFSISLSAQKMPSPPTCKKIPKTTTIHGIAVEDNYAWLKDKDNKAAMKYIKAENAYTKAVMKPVKDLQKKLYEEILSRIDQTDESVPVKYRGYWYYERSEEGKNYTINCRKKESLTAPEEVILDENEIIKKFKYYSVDGYEISPNNELMAYFVDKTGNFENDIYFKNLTNGEAIADTLHLVSSLAWANDNKTIFYSVQDKVTNRSLKVFKHILGQPSAKDELIFFEKDSLYDVYVDKSKSEQYIFILSWSLEQVEYQYTSANAPNDKFKVVQERIKGHQYYVFHFEDQFYIMSSYEAPNFKLVKTSIEKPSMENWKEVIPHRANVMIEDVELFKDFMVVRENQRARYEIRIINWSTNEEHNIQFDEDTHYAWIGDNPEFDTKTLRYKYISLRIPGSVYDYNMEDKTQELLKRDKILGGYDPDNYVSERIWIDGHDGTKIPVSLFYKKGLKKDGSNPLYITSYGSYGSSSLCGHNSARLNMLDRGFIYAIAHVRGGSDLGRAWYDGGKLLNKKNTFFDFISCTEALIDQGYTSKGNVAAYGGSAGGLLMGAIVNMRPDLYKAVVLDAPFVDVMNTMLDPSIPLTTQEYEEWGNPNDKTYYDYMVSYSPYDNVKAQDYPNMLFKTGLTDEQVNYSEPLKMTAKLRDMKTDQNTLLINIKMESGHAGVSGRYNRYDEIAFMQAFILSRFGIWE